MICVIATSEIKTEKFQDFVAILKKNIPLVRAENGCIQYEANVDCNSGFSAQKYMPNRITFVEKWESVDALKAHLASPHMNKYREATRDMVLAKTFNVVESV